MELLYAFLSGAVIGGSVVGYELRKNWLRDRLHLTREIKRLTKDLRLEEQNTEDMIGVYRARNLELIRERDAAQRDLHAVKAERVAALKEVRAS